MRKKGEGPTGDPDLHVCRQAGWLFAATADLIRKCRWCSALGLDILNRTAEAGQKATAGSDEIAGHGGKSSGSKFTFTHNASVLFTKQGNHILGSAWGIGNQRYHIVSSVPV